jgi:hypothetical protein
LDNSNNKLDEFFDEIKKLDISEIFSSLYTIYGEFRDYLTGPAGVPGCASEGLPLPGTPAARQPGWER